MDFNRIRIAAKDGKVIGACVFNDPDSEPERFDPFGVGEMLAATTLLKGESKREFWVMTHNENCFLS